MRTSVIFTIIGLLTVSGEKRLEEDADIHESSESQSPSTLLRTISFYGTDNDYGIELNGDKAFMRIEPKPIKRIEIPYEDGLQLLEGFYTISGIEDFRGKASDNRQTSLHYLVMTYDQIPERYSEDWVDYVIPKSEVPNHPEIRAWFDKMSQAKEMAEQSVVE